MMHMDLPIQLEFFAKTGYSNAAAAFKDFFIVLVKGALSDFHYVPTTANMKAASIDDLILAFRKK